MMSVERLFPLIALILLALSTAWLEWMSRPPATETERAVRVDPDFIGEDIRMTQFNADGSPRYELIAERVVNYPHSGITDFELPRLRYQTDDGELRVTAEHGESHDEGEILYLSGDVFVHRVATPGNPEFTLRSDTLTVWPDTQRAATDDPVVLTRNNSVAHGEGMRADNLYGTLELLGDARVHIPSRSATQGTP